MVITARNARFEFEELERVEIARREEYWYVELRGKDFSVMLEMSESFFDLVNFTQCKFGCAFPKEPAYLFFEKTAEGEISIEIDGEFTAGLTAPNGWILEFGDIQLFLSDDEFQALVQAVDAFLPPVPDVVP